MATAHTLRVSPRHLRDGWRRIGPRLLVGLLLVIVPTGVIGVVAAQRFDALATTTTELSMQDLPEVVAIGHLRTLLYRQRDLERAEAHDRAAQTALRASIAAQQSALQALEPPDSAATRANDTTLITGLTTGITRAGALALRLQALRAGGRVAAAHALFQHAYAPLLDTVLADTARLRTLEEGEAAAAAALVRRESRAATQVVLALTLLSVPLSLVLAVLLTRSLTTPLAALLRATDALAGGDLEAGPRPWVSTGDEIGRLAAAFEAMRVNLRATIAALALERRQTQAIIDASADGVILVDARQRVVEVNPAATRLTGWPAVAAVGQPWWVVCGRGEELAAEDAWTAPGGDTGERPGSRAPGGGQAPSAPDAGQAPPDRVIPAAGDRAPAAAREVLIHPRAGEDRWLAVSRAPVPPSAGATEQRVVVNLHDISQLKALDQMKSDFVAMVSHELRAPLTTVGGAVEMLGLLDPATDGGSYGEVVGILEQQTRRLRAVIEEVLQVTRLEAGRLSVRLRPLPLVAFLRALLERVRAEGGGDTRTVRLRVTDDETLVWADPAMLEIVLRNLLDNARKYTPAGSVVEVEVRDDPAAGRVQVRVRDHGPGIPPDQRERIFERFARGGRAGAEWTRGYGLGLYITRELLRAHNGALWADPVEEGACFVCALCPVVATTADERGDQHAEGLADERGDQGPETQADERAARTARGAAR